MTFLMSAVLVQEASLSAYDTGGRPRAEWRRIEPGATFAGEAAITNGRVTVKAGAGGVELFGADARRATLPAAGAPVLMELTRGSATLAVGGLRVTLKRGDRFVEVRGEAVLRVEAPGRFAVLPDFFADDILVDARAWPDDRAELPSENLLLHFTGAGDSIVMAAFEHRDQDVRVTFDGRGELRRIAGSEIDFGKGGRIWLALLEAPGIWHAIDLPATPIVALDWTMPFAAQWRVDFTRRGGLTDSWDLLLQEKAGAEFIKPSWLENDGALLAASRTASGEIDRDAYKPGGPASERIGPDRKRWTTVLGHFHYPCWSDPEGRGFLQPLKHERATFAGPVLLYPLSRLSRTPADTTTPLDVMRQTLGMGPCRHLLDVEGQKQEHVGRATCHVRSLLNEIYGVGQQKQKAQEIDAYLGDALDFVTHIRARILAYVQWGRELREYLAAQKKAHPEMAEFLEEVGALAGEIETALEPRMKKMREHPVLEEIARRLPDPTTPVLVTELNRAFRERLAGYEGADWKERLKAEYTDPLTRIGGQQDDVVGECRWVVKALRQKAALRMATDPASAAVTAEIRARTQKILRAGAAYEGARH